MAFNDSLHIPLKAIEGKWHIHFTNLSMWTKGKLTRPAFNYSIEQRGKVTGLKDLVTYKKGSELKSIHGFDWSLDASNTRFLWRGKGLLWLIKNKWEILYIDDELMVIHFAKTLFTDEGNDVVTRSEVLNEALLSKIQQKITEFKLENMQRIAL